MITVRSYNNAIIIRGHDDKNICEQVSLSVGMFINMIRPFDCLISDYHSDTDDNLVNKLRGMTNVIFKETSITFILRDMFTETLILWFNRYYPNRVTVLRITENYVEGQNDSEN